MEKKYRVWEEESYSGSRYFNFEFTDEDLKDEFETEIGYSSQYSIRLSDHKRPSVIDGYASYEHKYLYDTKYEEDFNLAKEYLIDVLEKYCDGMIDINRLDDLLFDVNLQSIQDYLGK